MRRSYVTRARVGALRERLTDRELAILRSLKTVRLATGGQLQRLHFTDLQGSPLSQARQCRRVLNKLTAWRLLARLPRQIGGVRAGSKGYVYSLDVAGQRLSELRDPVRRARSAWTPSLLFLNHALTVTEVYVQLVEAQRAGRGQLVEFGGEPACWRRFWTVAGLPTVLKPDAYVRLKTPAYEEFWFLEIDLGNESPWTLRRKCERYYQYWVSGQEQKLHGVFPAVLWCVPDRSRANVVEEVLHRLRDGRQLFRVACISEVATVLTAADGSGVGAAC
jgi:hypothetical protein